MSERSEFSYAYLVLLFFYANILVGGTDIYFGSQVMNVGKIDIHSSCGKGCILILLRQIRCCTKPRSLARQYEHLLPGAAGLRILRRLYFKLL